MGPPVGKSPSRSMGRTFLSATPVLVLGFAVFVIALNIRHYSTLCDAEEGRQGALFAAAIERRIKTLESEVNQNRLFTERVLQGLDAAFQASAVLSVEELRLLAQKEASEIGQRRARQPPPPMSDFARSRVSEAVESGNLQDLVEAAVGAGLDVSSYSSPLVGGRARGGGGQNQGWDWGSPNSAVADDFLGSIDVEVAQAPELDVSHEERTTLCRGWLEEHHVTPGVDWGTLPQEQQKLWVRYRCDEIALDHLAAKAGPQLAVESPSKREPIPPGPAAPGVVASSEAEDTGTGDGELDVESGLEEGASDSLEDRRDGRGRVSR